MTLHEKLCKHWSKLYKVTKLTILVSQKNHRNSHVNLIKPFYFVTLSMQAIIVYIKENNYLLKILLLIILNLSKQAHKDLSK